MNKVDRKLCSFCRFDAISKPFRKMAIVTGFVSVYLAPGVSRADFVYTTASTFVRATQNPTSDNRGNSMHASDSGYTEHTQFPGGDTQDIGFRYERNAKVDVPTRGSASAAASITLKGTIGTGVSGSDVIDLSEYSGSMFADEDTTAIPQFHAYATATTTGYTPALQPLPQQAFSAEAEIRFEDEIHFTFNPFAAIVNPVENLGIVFGIHGTLDATASPSVPAPSRPISGVSGYIRFDNSVTLLDKLIDSEIGHASVDEVNSASGFKDVSFSFLLNTFVNTTNVTGYATETATADFSHTIEVLGIIPYDRYGNVLPSDSITATSAFGFHYAVLGSAATVPEPSSLALLGIGGVGLALGASRRRRGA